MITELCTQYEHEDFSGMDFSGMDLCGYTFSHCKFRCCKLSDLSTKRCLFTSCDFSMAQLNGSDHQNSAFIN